MKFLKKILFRPESFLLIILIIITYSFTWQKDNWQRNILSSDGRGYYAYLPAIFLFQDLTYQRNTDAIEKELGYEMGHHYILKDRNGETFNKTFPGVAICLTPLFLLATFLSYLFGTELNGYTEIYLVAVQISAILACVIGYFFLKKLLIQRKINIQLSILIPLIVIFGTNVYYYTCNGASMGHIYSFMWMSIFVYYTSLCLQVYRQKYLLLCAFSLALIIMIRPTNGIIILLVPFLAGSFSRFINFLKLLFQRKKDLITSLLVGGALLSLLPIIWYLQTGHLIVWSYTGEGFYFSKPLIHKVLFSFRNGLFVYAPLSILLFGGIYLAYRKDKFSGAFAAFYFLVNVYIISSWWTFYYGGGFGHRAMTEHHVFTIIMIATFVNGITPFLQKVFYGLSFLLVGLSVFQGFQTVKGILPNDYVDYEMYKLVFLKWDDKYIGECDATLDIRQFGKIRDIQYLRPQNFEQEPILHFDQSKEFGGDAAYVLPELAPETHLFLEYYFTKKRISTSTFEDVFMVVVGEDKIGNQVFYEASKLYQIRSEAFNEFKPLQITLQLPKENVSVFKFYIWNKGKQEFEIKDIDIRIVQIMP